MTWFDRLTGFPEESPEKVRENLAVDGERMTSLVTRRAFSCGRLETPSLGDLRDRIARSRHPPGTLSVRELVANVRDLHADAANTGCLFQVASQFNLLEMVSPDVTPERGVGIYENDFTQGPTCAIAAGAGTIYRNYFAMVNGHAGQSARSQIDCLADLGVALGNSKQELWEMSNGYALASREGLDAITRRLDASSENEVDELRRLLRIGIHRNTQVTIEDSRHTVTQVYCSALPVAYANHSPEPWERFARLTLDAAYEATICGAILNSLSTGNKSVFLTLLGGGAFGNRDDWIMAGIKRALTLYKDWPLEVAIVSYGASKPPVRQLVEALQRHPML